MKIKQVVILVILVIIQKKELQNVLDVQKELFQDIVELHHVIIVLLDIILMKTKQVVIFVKKDIIQKKAHIYALNALQGQLQIVIEHHASNSITIIQKSYFHLIVVNAKLEQIQEKKKIVIFI